jgi:hypothetical protein
LELGNQQEVLKMMVQNKGNMAMTIAEKLRQEGKLWKV